MRDGWRKVSLGELFEPSNDRLGDHENEPPVFAISKYDGVVLASEYHERRVASDKLNGYKTLGSKDWAYSTIHIDEGSIARNNHRFLGVVSPMYTVLRWREVEHEPRYFEYLLRSPAMLASYRDMAQGSINRRRSLSWKVFSLLEVGVPSLPEQRRIVDLIGAVDEAIEAADRAESEANMLLDGFRLHFHLGSSAPLGELAIMRSGPSWKAADESEDCGDGFAPVLGITNAPPGRDFHLSQRKFVRGLSNTVMRLTASSLVMIRTNGNRSRIGNVYRATPDVVGYAVSAFQIAVEPTDAANSSFLYWILGGPSFQQRISEAASGSTGLGNIAIGWLKALKVPYSGNRADIDDFTGRCEAMGAVADSCRTEASTLRALRSELLSTLLAGEHHIPDSYDELIGV